MSEQGDAKIDEKDQDVLQQEAAEEQVAEENSTDESASAEESPAGQTETDPLAELTEKVKQLEESNQKLKEDYLRKQADFDNFRKRMFREKEESIKFANKDLLNDIILIIDDFERAIGSSGESKDFDSFHEGITLIEKQFVGMLERKYGLKRFESKGEEFDPQLHEAIGMEPSEEHDIQVVLEDYQKGYMLNERVLRHAKVKVSMPQATPVANDKPDEDQ